MTRTKAARRADTFRAGDEFFERRRNMFYERCAKEFGPQPKKKRVKLEPEVWLTSVKIENPEHAFQHDEKLGNPKFIHAPFNMRESPVTWMLKQKTIDEAQAKAASRFRSLYEAAGGAGVKALNYTKEPVDGGGFPDVLTDRKHRAGLELAEVQNFLGRAGFGLVEQICGQCIWIKDIEPTKYRQIKTGKRLKECLTALAQFWNYQSRPITSWRKVS